MEKKYYVSNVITTIKIHLKRKLHTSKVIVRILVVFRVLLSPLQSLQRLVLTLVRI